MEWAVIFAESNVVGFILLFFRFGALFMALPIFSHQNIPLTVKVSMAFFFTVVFYPIMPALLFDVNIYTILGAVFSELLFGLSIGLVIQITYNIITFAGGQISYMMGFSMASAIDPQTGVSMPIISQFLAMLALMLLLSLDMHHWVLLFVNESLSAIPLGGFILEQNLFDYLIRASTNMFVVGFMIAFPIIALSFLQDIIFGMLMKTMPQFNLLVIGFPIKIGVALVVIIATLASTMLIMQREILASFNWLENLF